VQLRSYDRAANGAEQDRRQESNTGHAEAPEDAHYAPATLAEYGFAA
jgi:hypothetical protein